MTVIPQQAILLARISDARGDDTHGVDGQVDGGHAHAARLGWGIGPASTHVIVENDTSAFKRRKITLPDGRKELRTVRPGFRRALAMLATGEADGLIAIDLDRACRDPRDLEDLIDIVESHRPRIPVESVTGSLRLANDSDVTTARIMVAVANKASRDTGRRVSNARKLQAATGRYGGGRRSFGFEPDGVTIRPSEAAEITRASEAILTGVSLRQVLLDVRGRGIPTVTGARWSSATLRDILLRPRNAGLMVYRDSGYHGPPYSDDEIIGRAPWPPIIPESTWRAVAAILTDPARTQTPGNTPRWLGSLIYRCGICDDGATCRVHAVRALGGQYRCEQGHLSRSAPRADEYVTEVITNWLAKPEAARVLQVPVDEPDLPALRREAASLRELLDEQARLHARRIIDTRQLEAGSGELRGKLNGIEGRLAAYARRDPLDGIAGNPDAAQVWEGLGLGRQRAALTALVAVTLHPARPGRQRGGGYFDHGSVRFGPWYR